MSASRESALSRILFLRLNENRWSRLLEKTLGQTPPGGVLLAESFPQSPGAAVEFIGKIRRACRDPLFIAMREEGGAHNPLARYFPPLPSSHAAGENGVISVERLGDLTGKALRMLGVNVNFSPTLDLLSPLNEKRLAGRSFGSNPQFVAECGAAYLRGLSRHKILACGKHFPGWGSVPFGNGSGLQVSAKAMAALWSEDLIPFRRLLPKLPMVLMCSAAYKAYDFELPRPASLSSFVIGGLLREKLGYRGLAIGFDLEQKSVHGTLGFAEAVVQAVSAGCDMVMVDQGTAFSSALKALKENADSERLASRRASEALARVRAAQKRIATGGAKASPKAIARLRDEFEKFSDSFVSEEPRNV